MLVLTRKKDQGVVIGDAGDEVTVTVIEVQGNRVRLGFTGPDGVAIDRVEVRLRKPADPRVQQAA